MTALDGDGEEAAVDETGEMAAGGRRRNARSARQFAGGQRSTIHQGDQHRGARGLADKGACPGEAGNAAHLATVPQVTRRCFGLDRNIRFVAAP